MKKTVWFVFWMCVASVALQSASAQSPENVSDKAAKPQLQSIVPPLLDYQGYLADNNGLPISGAVEMTFSLWSDSTGGDKLWESTRTVQVNKGYFSCELGQETALPGGLFDGSRRFLQLRVRDEVLSPRKPLTSVAYALFAENTAFWQGLQPADFYTQEQAKDHKKNEIDASRLGGFDASVYLTSEQVQANYIKRNALNSISGEMIIDGSVKRQDLGFSMGQGTITGVRTDAGLTGGGNSGEISLSLDAVYLSGQAYDDRFVPRGEQGVIRGEMISDNAITSDHIRTASLKENDFGFPIGKITSLVAGTGLTGGGVSGTVTLGLNANYESGSAYDGRFVNVDEFQAVTGAMVADGSLTGSDIKDGTIQPVDLAATLGDITSVQTGPGLLGGRSEGDVTLQLSSEILNGSAYDNRFVKEGQTDAVTSTMIQNGSLKPEDLSFPVGDVTAVYTNTGLQGGGSNGDLVLSLQQMYQDGSAYDNRFVQRNESGVINSSMILDRSVGSFDLSDGILRDRHFPTALAYTRTRTSGAILDITNTSTSPNSSAIKGFGAVGVYGTGDVAVKGEGNVYGVHAVCNNDYGYGLYVEGRATCTTGEWADVAEYVYGQDGLENGDVVIIDPQSELRVRRCETPYDSRVAGVVSTQPTIEVGHLVNSSEGVPLALTGIVPCKVTTEAGAIQPGDLLTTSSVPGHAMKANDPKIGTLVGKAMEPLASGRGIIHVLVGTH